MNYQTITFAINDTGVATLTMNRPAVSNAFNAEMIAEMTHALAICASDHQIRLLILQSSGQHFSAGADLNWMKSMARMSYEENRSDAACLSNLMHALYSLGKPTIARVNGASFGGAVGLIACCDMAFAIDTATFCLSEVKLGLVPAVISPYVIKAIGQRNASRYFLTAEVFDAASATDMGLLSACCKEAELDAMIDKVSGLILKNGPQAVQQAKALVQHVSDQPIDDGIRNHTIDLIASIRVSEEGQEGLNAFLGKRKPAWGA